MAEDECRGKRETVQSFQQGSEWFCHDVQAAQYRYPLQQAIRQGRTLLVWLLRSAERPTYFPMWCWGKRSVDHQSLKFSFSSCGYIHICDTASDVKWEEKAAFSTRCKHRDICPLILISVHKYSFITRYKPLRSSLLLYLCYNPSQQWSGNITATYSAGTSKTSCSLSSLAAAYLYLETQLETPKIQLAAYTTLKRRSKNWNP